MAPELPLLERETALAALDAALARAQAGRGCCVVVSGEAGIGKSRLIQAWAEGQVAVQWLYAACDPLITPRPLGPLVDLADRLPPTLCDAVHEARTYNGLFPQLVAWLAQTKPVPVLALEDLHWADEATLDCVRYLGRRIARLPALLLLTRRDDEPSPALARTLAQLDASVTVQLALPPLSDAALRRAAATRGHDDPSRVRLAGGNPLFLQQLLACQPGELPGGVRDAVVARLARLPPRHRHLMQVLAVSPGGLEPARLAALAGDEIDTLDHPEVASWLRRSPTMVAFRHELVRQAVEVATPAARRAAAHAALADLLATAAPRTGLLARRLHHAAAAGRAAEVAALAGPAADEAERAGAPAAAAEVLRLALDQADAAGVDDRQRVQWGLALARHQARSGELAQAVTGLEQVRVLARRAGDTSGEVRAAANLALMSSPRPESVEHAEAALALAQPLGGSEAALACYALALALHNRGDPQGARPHAEAAVALAEDSGDSLTLSQALSVCGAVTLMLDADDAGFGLLERGIALANHARRHGAAAVAWVNLASLCLARADFQRLEAATARAIPFCHEHDEDLAGAMLLLRRALGWIETGAWAAVDEALQDLAQTAGVPARSRSSADLLRMRLAGLRGRPADDAAWRQAATRVEAGETEFLPADACGYAAEAIWLHPGIDTEARAGRLSGWARQGLAQATTPWLAGRLRRWLRLGGEDPGPAPTDLPAPFAAEERGDAVGAQAAWQAMGCPAEAAIGVLAAVDGEPPDRLPRSSLQAALNDAQALGAAVLAERLRQRLRQTSTAARGPYRAASAHPLGFTARESQVADLLAAGLSNAQIAARLHRSARTVEHHVSAILAKLAVQTRTQAVARLLVGDPPSVGQGPKSG